MTPVEKLARSRLAIIEYLQPRDQRAERRDQRERSEADGGQRAADDGGDAGTAAGWLGGLSSAARTWWRHHPAQMALDLATPALGAYLRRRPFQVLALSAGVGALLVVTRPWRLISVTTLVVAIVKSSQLSGVVLSALADAQGWQRQQQGHEPEL